MAQKVLVKMVDDLDGGTATQMVPFALDGVAYEIDLSDGRGGSTSAASREHNQQVHAWALANGYDISERGRITNEIYAAFEAGEATVAAEPQPVGEAAAKSARKRAAEEG